MAIQTDETMVVLPEKELYETDIYGKGLETDAEGGVDGEANTGLRGLVNRTAWLRKIVLQLQTSFNNIDLGKYALKAHSHPYLPSNGKAVDSDKLDGKDSSSFSLSHSHPYLPSNGKAVDSDKLAGLPLNQVRPQLLYKHADPSIDLTDTYINYMSVWFTARGKVCVFTASCSVRPEVTNAIDIWLTTKLWCHTTQEYVGVPTNTIMTVRDLYNSPQLVNSIGHSFMIPGHVYVLQVFVRKGYLVGPIPLRRIEVTGISE